MAQARPALGTRKAAFRSATSRRWVPRSDAHTKLLLTLLRSTELLFDTKPTLWPTVLFDTDCCVGYPLKNHFDTCVGGPAATHNPTQRSNGGSDVINEVASKGQRLSPSKVKSKRFPSHFHRTDSKLSPHKAILWIQMAAKFRCGGAADLALCWPSFFLYCLLRLRSYRAASASCQVTQNCAESTQHCSLFPFVPFFLHHASPKCPHGACRLLPLLRCRRRRRHELARVFDRRRQHNDDDDEDDHVNEGHGWHGQRR